MDKRQKIRPSTEESMRKRDEFYASIQSGELSIPKAVVSMRKISRLTQPEFAKHRGISVQALRQIESGLGNPTVETLNKVASIFGLQVGFCIRPTNAENIAPENKSNLT